MKKVVSYVRVSSDEQAKHGFSVEQQKRNNERFATMNGYRVVKVFEDGGKSAGNMNREGLQKLIEYCADKKNEIEAVIIWKLDRISRNMADYSARLLPFFNEQGIKLLTVEGTNGDGVDAEMQRQISMVWSEYERKQGVIRTKEAIRGKVATGQYPYKPPIGYKNIMRPGSRYKEMIIDEENVFWIKTIYNLALKGDSIKTITDKVYKMGFRNNQGKRHPKSEIHCILHNITYTGKFYFEGKLIEDANYPAIISEIEFLAVQEKISAPNKTRQTHSEFPYTECMHCSKCGSQMTAEKKKKVSGKGVRYYTYYHCTGSKGGTCKKDSYIREERVEEAIVEILKYITIPENVLEDVKKGLKEIHKKQGTDLEYRKKALRKRIDKIDDNIKSAFESGIDATSDGLKLAIQQWETERKTLLLEEEQLLMATKQFYEESNLLLSFCNNAYKTFQEGNAEEKRGLVKIIILMLLNYNNF